MIKSQSKIVRPINFLLKKINPNKNILVVVSSVL